jgi:Ring finger domain
MSVVNVSEAGQELTECHPSPPRCVICLEQDPLTYPMSHRFTCQCQGCVFHADCFSRYMQYKQTCPICRGPLDAVEPGLAIVPVVYQVPEVYRLSYAGIVLSDVQPIRRTRPSVRWYRGCQVLCVTLYICSLTNLFMIPKNAGLRIFPILHVFYLVDVFMLYHTYPPMRMYTATHHAASALSLALFLFEAIFSPLQPFNIAAHIILCILHICYGVHLYYTEGEAV